VAPPLKSSSAAGLAAAAATPACAAQSEHGKCQRPHIAPQRSALMLTHPHVVDEGVGLAGHALVFLEIPGVCVGSVGEVCADKHGVTRHHHQVAQRRRAGHGRRARRQLALQLRVRRRSA
jgi:hypothetical protein